MTDAINNPPDLKSSDRPDETARRSAHRVSRTLPATAAGVRRQAVCSDELDRLHRALFDVTQQTHPRTARLLASSTRKTAQKVIEEAGEVALEAVRHRATGIVRESADLLYHLVALWHRAGIDPQDVWSEMRCRADTLGIAEKRPKKLPGKLFRKTTRRAAVTGCGLSRPCNPPKQSRTRT